MKQWFQDIRHHAINDISLEREETDETSTVSVLQPHLGGIQATVEDGKWRLADSLSWRR